MSTETALVPFASAGVALTEHSTLGRTGLAIAEGTPPEELLQIAAGFGAIDDAKCFGVGDLANALKAAYPAEYRQWIDRDRPVGNLDKKTVLVYAAVAAAFPMAQRTEIFTEWPGISFSHFSRVRRYGPQLAEYWLKRAASEQLSLNDLEGLLEQGTPGSDEVPVVTEPTIQRGEFVWLGPPEDPTRHLLYCGDCTDAAVLANGINAMGERASMMWTDPPYGVEYVGKTEDALTIDNDGAEDLDDLLPRAWAAVTPCLAESAAIYIAGPTGDNAASFISSIKGAGWRFKQMLVWVKNTIVLGRQDYHLRHEGIYYAQAPGPLVGRRPGQEDKLWYGGDNQSSIFFVDKPAASRDHPTMKPVKLIIPAIENSSRAGEVVIDPFSGSGSTLIAADQTGRRCFAIEYDPAYASVIQARYVKHLETQAALGIKGWVEGQVMEQPDYGPGVFEE